MIGNTTDSGQTQLTAFDLKAYLENRCRRVNTALSALSATAHPDSRLTRAMQYSLEAGGKRLRPILCMAAAEAVGGDADTTLPACCAIEMIHTYSLIHDDLPAMDDDDLRRGKPTCHIAFDEATAILAGDGLLTLAFQVLSRPENRFRKNDSQQWLRVVHVLAVAAGPDGMIEGQIRDIAAEGKGLDRRHLQALHELKTGAMIRASVAIGGILGGASEAELTQLERYAQKIGLAFQVMDDILDVEGDPHTMGKRGGADERLSKSTYPRLMGIDASKDLALQLVDDGLKAIGNFDNKSDPLRAIARYIVTRKR